MFNVVYGHLPIEKLEQEKEIKFGERITNKL